MPQLPPIPVVQPFPWESLLAYLSLRAIPEVERIHDGTYQRRLERGSVVVSFDPRRSQLVLSAEGWIDVETVRRNVSALFDVGFDSSDVAERLGRSRLLVARMRKVPGMRPLGAWSAFELCVRTILGQQVTVAAAGTLMRRWVQRCRTITPRAVLAAELSQIGMPNKRVEAIRAFALAVQERRVRFDRPWSEVNAMLAQLPGFGPWTREYLAIRLGRQPDAFPATDLGLIRAANVASPAELLKLAERWRPYRAYAATYLWAVARPTR